MWTDVAAHMSSRGHFSRPLSAAVISEFKSAAVRRPYLTRYSCLHVQAAVQSSANACAASLSAIFWGPGSDWEIQKLYVVMRRVARYETWIAHVGLCMGILYTAITPLQFQRAKCPHHKGRGRMTVCYDSLVWLGAVWTAIVKWGSSSVALKSFASYECCAL